MAVERPQIEKFVCDSIAKVLSAVEGSPYPLASTPQRSAPVDIAISVHDSARILDRCLKSLLPTLGKEDRVWLDHPAGHEEEFSRLIHAFGPSWPQTIRPTNAETAPFRVSDHGMFELSDRDLVLLDSGAQVSDGWIEHMQASLDRNPEAGIICPISDNATILSVLPAVSEHDRGHLVEAAACYTVGDCQLPTASGFCMLIRRALIEEIGGYCRVFEPGHGAVYDLSMRAIRAGWDIIAADRACVFQYPGSCNFAEERRGPLWRNSQLTLDRIWPEFGPLVQAWWGENPLRSKTEHLAWRGDSRPGVLHVLHRPQHIGGTERVTRTLLTVLTPSYRQTLVYPGLTVGKWCDFELQSSDGHRELMFNQRWIRPKTRISGHGADLTCSKGERALARVIRGSETRIVHFHHMLHWDSLLLPALARNLGCRVVISVHDFWFNCPQYNQMEFATGWPCGRSYAHADARCQACLSKHSDMPLQTGAFARARYGLIRDMLEAADALVVPSAFIKHKVLDAYPGISADAVHLVPHGVKRPGELSMPSRGPTKIVAFLGGDQMAKGAGLVLGMARLLKDAPVAFRIFGRSVGYGQLEMPGNVSLHGYYHPEQIGDCLQEVDLVLIPSCFEESFSLVASECWAHGVPVLSSTRGALGERVRPGLNGWLVPDLEPATWARRLVDILRSNELQRCRQNLQDQPVTTVEQSADAIHRIYQRLLALPRLATLETDTDRRLKRFRGKLDDLRVSRGTRRAPTIDQPCLGIIRDNWAPASYRVRYPLEDLRRSGAINSCAIQVVKDAGMEVNRLLQEMVPRKVLVQPFLSDRGLRMMETLHREPYLEIILVVDDLWTHVPAENPVNKLIPKDVANRLHYLASLSDTLVFTTEELRRRLGMGHNNTHVINNALPEWLWMPAASTRPPAGKRLRIGWAGAPQHAGDLAFLEKVIEATHHAADWVLMGMCPGHLRPLVNEFQPMVPLREYPKALSNQRIDVAIAPLTANPFNRCKSHLKVLEYGILGLPVVAADLEPYQHAPVQLARPDDPEDWIAKIRALLADDGLRDELGGKLRRWVTQHHMCEHRRSDWLAALRVKTDAP